MLIYFWLAESLLVSEKGLRPADIDDGKMWDGFM
jgi:hypothetical protein